MRDKAQLDRAQGKPKERRPAAEAEEPAGAQILRIFAISQVASKLKRV